MLTRSSPFRATACLVLGVVALAVAPAASGFTAADARSMYDSYNEAFYFSVDGNGYYRQSTEGGKTFFWDRAEQMEMVLDVYERTTNAACLNTFSNLFSGFVADHGTNWMHNEFNDDIMWMVIACVRAHQQTGNPVFREIARDNFDRCYARAWSTNLGGGLWWKTANQSKNACVNGPGSIAAFLLYQACRDTAYLAKAKAVYAWERTTLFNADTGQIYDNIRTNGDIAERAFTYNEGTFIGAANFLGRTNDARLAADYTMNTLSRGGQLMPAFGTGGDAAGFNGICGRWLAKFMRERGLEGRYEAWLQHNAEAAWKTRRRSDNLSWNRWLWDTPSGPLDSWACCSSVVLVHVVPATQPGSSR
jgi:predicted alpha-1,6-mannanase (GH76 family)